MAKNKQPKKLTPRQKKFVSLTPKIASGELTVEEALKQAGYSENTARQQTKITRAVRHSSAMQDALRASGFTEEFLSKVIVGDIKALRPGQARRQYAELGAKLLDSFPEERSKITVGTVEEALDEADEGTDYAEWTNPQEAK